MEGFFTTSWMTSNLNTNVDGGSGSSLNPIVLLSAAIATLVATAVTATSIWLQLKNYRKPALQRMVVRIMIMVPLYAISSLIALFSLNAAFFIDAVRDIYEAFVIYCFFHLLVGYLGGERSLLILLYGRPPKQHVFPVSIVKREFDGSDPFTFLGIRRGIFQYVYVKPVLAIVTMILKAAGVYNEGSFKLTSGYTWVSIIYNISICLSLYCLAMFWICINDDIKPFRPMPKFLCIKGILFFSFWQSIVVSLLVSAGAITRIGPYTDEEHISLAITDFLVCFEMPFFAIAHTFAFSHTDYIDHDLHYAARMPMWYAIRDAFGFIDVLMDTRATLKGGVSYKEYEPVEGGMHQEFGRNRRIRAGLRYAKGGQQKYWLPMPEESAEPVTGPITAARNFLEHQRDMKKGYAPLLEDQEDDVVHSDHPTPVTSPNRDTFLSATSEPAAFGSPSPDDEDELDELEFHQPDAEEDAVYAESQKLLFGDYNYPCIDVSSEQAQKMMWDEEERILSDQRAAAWSPLRGEDGKIPTTPSAILAVQRGQIRGYGASGQTHTPGRSDGKGKTKVYGSGVDDYGFGQRQDTPPRFDERGAVIDMAPEAKTPDIAVDGVRLSLSKANNVTPQNSRPKGRQSKSSSQESRHLAPTNHRPTPSNRTSTSSLRSTTPSDRQPRKDAVDLVIEDRGAAQEEMQNERRRGEPAVRGSGQRRVFKAAYTIADEDEEEKDVKVEHEVEPGVPDPRRGSNPAVDQTRVKVGGSTSETNIHITRATTPPPHANVEWETNARAPPRLDYGMDPEDNPWA